MRWKTVADPEVQGNGGLYWVIHFIGSCYVPVMYRRSVRLDVNCRCLHINTWLRFFCSFLF